MQSHAQGRPGQTSTLGPGSSSQPYSRIVGPRVTESNLAGAKHGSHVVRPDTHANLGCPPLKPTPPKKTTHYHHLHHFQPSINNKRNKTEDSRRDEQKVTDKLQAMYDTHATDVSDLEAQLADHEAQHLALRQDNQRLRDASKTLEGTTH